MTPRGLARPQSYDHQSKGIKHADMKRMNNKRAESLYHNSGPVGIIKRRKLEDQTQPN